MRILPLFLILILSFSFVAAECTDSDEGKNKYEFGAVTYNFETYEDSCDSANTINEYFCSVDGIASFTILPCVNGCENGECIVSGEAPKALAPEEDITSNLKLYFYGFIVLVIIGLYLYWFKLKRR